MINFPNHDDKTVSLGENNLVTLFILGLKRIAAFPFTAFC